LFPEAFVFHFVTPKHKDVNKYKTVKQNFDLYGCATWTVTLREEHKLTVFENRVLEKLLWPKKEATGDWRKLHNEELHDLYWSQNIIGMIIR
jgi:hypothetical protein